ncbi:hypothetical protein C8Q75DRAFT_157264 [Abortiporus biennis]|nr:hypothetical protein C8Q75DRAFT_157264 [Abortiporus biennis]
MLKNVGRAVADVPDVRQTMGAILLGTLISLFLSGAVTIQAILYFRSHSGDRRIFRILVAVVWVLDLLHSAMLCNADWYYFIANFGDLNTTLQIPWQIAITIALTALITFLIHLFFSYRIYLLSKNIYIIIPILLITTFRLSAALVSTVEMIRLGTYASYVSHFAWVYTVGLSASITVDILVTATLCYYLHKRRTGFASMNDIITSLTISTVENGSLTVVTTLIALIFWLVNHHDSLIFLGLHFTISKSYANAFLATLNLRRTTGGSSVSRSRSDGRSRPIIFRDEGGGVCLTRTSRSSDGLGSGLETTKVHINIETTIQEDDVEA